MRGKQTTREQLIVEHLATCQAAPCKKYDNKKSRNDYHSLEYSRRKCAKSMWRRHNK